MHRHARGARLASAFSRAEDAIKKSDWDTSLQSDLAQHLCVLLSGHVEAVVEDILADYALARGDARLQAAVRRLTDRFQNPRPTTLLDLLSGFDLEWHNRLEAYFAEDPARADALRSVIDNKNKIAHGDDSNVSYYKLRNDWYKRVVEILDFVEDLCLASRSSPGAVVDTPRSTRP